MSLTTNKNFLSPKNFKFILNRTPNLEYFCQSATIPAITMGASNLETPFIRMPVPGDRMLFGELTVNFRVDEDLQTYMELYDWMIALGFPESFEQYSLSQRRTDTTADTAVMSDARLIVTTNSMNPNYEVLFRDLYPYSLSELSFDTKESDVDYIEATVGFIYRDFKIIKLNA